MNGDLETGLLLSCSQLHKDKFTSGFGPEGNLFALNPKFILNSGSISFYSGPIQMKNIVLAISLVTRPGQ